MLGRGAAAGDAMDAGDDAGDPAPPAHRFASVAVRGAGFGDDAGPRLITIEDCRFADHRGYAVLVSPGIDLPEIPAAPAVTPQSSGQLYQRDEGGAGATATAAGGATG